MNRETVKISLGNIHGNEEKDRVRDGKDIGTVEKNGKKKEWLVRIKWRQSKTLLCSISFTNALFLFLGSRRQKILRDIFKKEGLHK